MNSDLNHTNQAPYLFYCQIGRNFLLPFAKSKANSLYLLVSKVNKRRGKILKSYYLDFFSFKKISFYFWKAFWSINACLLPWKLQKQRNMSPLRRLYCSEAMWNPQRSGAWIHMWYLNCGDFKCVSFSNFH